MKIHLACGRHILDGYTNIDLVKHPKAKKTPEILCDVRSIPIASESAEEVLAVHILEHFYLWEVEDLLKEWKRLLAPKGVLILELPDIVKAAKNLLNGADAQMSLWAFYGDPGPKDYLMCHHWGWTFDTLQPVLKSIGFKNIVQTCPRWHPVGMYSRDFRVEASV